MADYYNDVLEGLHERFATIEGLSIGDGEPTSVQVFPYMYSLFDRFERSQAGSVTVMRYYTIHRLCIQWQDTHVAEQTLRLYLDRIPASIDADPKLNGRINSGLATMIEASSGWFVLSQSKMRIVDFTSHVLVKFPFRS